MSIQSSLLLEGQAIVLLVLTICKENLLKRAKYAIQRTIMKHLVFFSVQYYTRRTYANFSIIKIINTGLAPDFIFLYSKV